MKKLEKSKKRGFTCENCGEFVSYEAPGTKNRNHCPFCLYSKHVDVAIGDRFSKCTGIMEPIGKIYKKDGEEVLIHKCTKCAQTRKNRIAGDDSFELVANLIEIKDIL